MLASKRLLSVVMVLCSVQSVLSADSLELSKLMTDFMVVQAETPAFFGWDKPGTVVTVAAGHDKGTSTAATGTGFWRVELAGRAASSIDDEAGDTIVIQSSTGSATLNHVLYGDVTVASGQSNAEFSMAEILGADHYLNLPTLNGLRLFAVEKNESTTVLDQLIDVQEGWVKSSPQTICGAEYSSNHTNYCQPHCGPSAAVKSYHRATWGFFSAIGWLFGYARMMETKRPQGVLETTWGGTSIERWSSEDASAQCSSKPASGQIYNSMVAPLLPFPISGALWYQGENNAKDSTSSNLYACQIKAMISDWRSKWMNSQQFKNFTFSVAQLAPDKDSEFMTLRYSQRAALDLPNTGLGVNIDLADPTSPCGAVHIRNKTAVVARLVGTLSAPGPQPSSFMSDPASNAVTVEFVSSADDLVSFRSVQQTTNPASQNFEVLVGSKWENAVASVVSGGTCACVSVSVPSGTDVTAIKGLRYAWSPVAEGKLLFDAKATPVSPFIASCSSGKCSLVEPGQVPEDWFR